MTSTPRGRSPRWVAIVMGDTPVTIATHAVSLSRNAALSSACICHVGPGSEAGT